jgi:hypothetical protein
MIMAQADSYITGQLADTRKTHYVKPFGTNLRAREKMELSELRTRQKKLTQSGKTTSKMSEEWGK